MDASALEEKPAPSDSAVQPVSTLSENAMSTVGSDKNDATPAQAEDSPEAEQGKDAASATDGVKDSNPEKADKDGAESTPSATTDAASPSKRAEEPEAEKPASSDETPQPKPIKRAAAGSVGKSGVKGPSTTPVAKRTPVAMMPSGAKVSSNSKKFDVIHAKQLAKEPTIYEHDKAKKAKADILLQSVTRATRSSARKIVSAKAKDEPTVPVAKKIVFKAARNHLSVLDRPTISSSLKRAETKQATKEKAGLARKASQPTAAPFTSTVTAGPKMSAPAAATKTGAKAAVDTKPRGALNYKPYTGPLPKYKEDPIFSPVNKEKIEAAKQPLKSVHTPAKKGKENLKRTLVKTTPSKSTAGRTPIKKATSSTQVTAKDDRRAKFAQESKTNATAARQSLRRAVNAAKA